jgi:hypothetical protein
MLVIIQFHSKMYSPDNIKHVNIFVLWQIIMNIYFDAILFAENRKWLWTLLDGWCKYKILPEKYKPDKILTINIFSANLRKTTISWFQCLNRVPAGRMLVFHEVIIWEPLAWASTDKQNMKSTLFSDMTPFRVVDVYRHFRGTCWLHYQGRWNTVDECSTSFGCQCTSTTLCSITFQKMQVFVVTADRFSNFMRRSTS